MNEPEDLEALLRELHDEPAPLERRSAAAIGRAADTASSGGDRARLDTWLRELVTRARPAICCSWPERPPRSGWTGASCPLGGAPLDGADNRGRGPGRAAAARRRTYRDGGIADASFRLPASAASASTCTASAAAPPRRSARCRRACRGSRRSTCRRRRSARAAAARAGADRRPDRLRQDDDAGGAGRRDQSARRAAHRHDRGSDRVRAPAPAQRRRAGGDRRRRARLSRRRCARRCARRRT